MTDQPYTPTTEQVRFAATFPNENFSLKGSDFDRWYAAEIAATEQRGAAKALLKAADAIRGNRLPSGNEHTELCDNCSIAAADHLLDRADQMEGDDA